MKNIIVKQGGLNVLCCILIGSLFNLNCASVVNSDAEKQKIIDAVIPEIEKRFLFDNCWMSVGATGIVDEQSAEYIQFGEKLDSDVIPLPGTDPDLVLSNIKHYGGTVYLSDAPKGLYRIRYPINQQFLFRINRQPTMEGSEKNEWNIILKGRYKVADKSEERVYIKLNRYSLNSPPDRERVETMLTLDSDDFPEADAFQVYGRTKQGVVFDFEEFGYFIDAQLIIKKDNPFPTSSQYQKGLGVAIGHIQVCKYTPPID